MNCIKKIISVICMTFIAVALLCSCGQKNGLVKENGNTYYYVNGEMQYGWQEIYGYWYYFYETDYYEGEYNLKGTMKYSTWLQIDGEYYFFDGDGKMLRDGLRKVDGNLYYFDRNGKMLHDTERMVKGSRFVFDSNGIGKEVPYYSAPAPMGGTYNFYFKNTFPLTLSYYSWTNDFGKWVILENPTIEVYGNSVTISGIVEYKNTKEVKGVNFDCRLSSVDENGITDSVVGYARSATIKGGEKTKFEIEIRKALPLVGRDIYIEFIGNK